MVYHLQLHKHWIIAKVEQGAPREDIRLQLYQQHSIKINIRTLGRKLQEWGVSYSTRLQTARANDMTALEARVVHAYRCLRLTDSETAAVLEDDGFIVGPRAVQRIRLRLGLKKRVGQDDWEEMENAIVQAVQGEIEKGDIEGYGYRMLWTHLNNKYDIVGRSVFLVSISNLKL